MLPELKPRVRSSNQVGRRHDSNGASRDRTALSELRKTLLRCQVSPRAQLQPGPGAPPRG